MTPDCERFLELVGRNPVIGEVLAGASELDLPGWYLTSGCLFQTVWNVIEGNDPQHGILDYDLFYFDDRDLSWEAENEAIQRSGERFGDLDVQVRNEARVHLWYEDHFGVPCPPYQSTEAAIDSFMATACCVGVRVVEGVPDVYAPHGFDDLFGFVIRPNPVLAPRAAYEAKTARWKELWPRLQVLPWPEAAA